MRPHFSSPGNQGDSPGQPLKRSLRAGTCVRYNYSVQLVAIWRARVPKRNNIFLEGGGSWSCTSLYRILNPKLTSILSLASALV